MCPASPGAFSGRWGRKSGSKATSGAPGELAGDAERIAGVLEPGSTVIVWGGEGDRALVDIAAKLDAKLLEVPDGANARGLREVGCLPDAGPGLSEASDGHNAAEIRDALAAGDLEAAFLLNADPVRDFPGGPAWSEALGKAKFVLAVSMFENATTRHADVVFPAEFYAEKEGTVTHPDGRLQRAAPRGPARDGCGRSGRCWWSSPRCSATRRGSTRRPRRSPRSPPRCPFYAGITHEEIGGRGVRWQERDAASALPQTTSERVAAAAQVARTRPGKRPRRLRRTDHMGTYRDLWASEVADRSPALRFLAPRQTLELSPADADRLGVVQGEEVDVRSNGTSLRARLAIRERIRPGAGFLVEGTVEANANALEPGVLVEIAKVGGET